MKIKFEDNERKQLKKYLILTVLAIALGTIIHVIGEQLTNWKDHFYA